MKTGRIDDGLSAEQKLRRLQSLSPAERRKVQAERRRKRDAFMTQARAILDDKPKKTIGSKHFTEEDLAAARLRGLDYHQLYQRTVTMGWPLEKAITTPVDRRLWTEGEDGLIRRALREGRSASQIARMLPNRSRTAVISRCTKIRRQIKGE